MSIEGQGHFFTIYFPGFVCFVLYKAIQVSVYRTIGPLVLFSNKMFHHISSAFTSARVFKFCIQDKDDQMYY